MTVPIEANSIESKSPSRRALLAGALGGVGVWATSLVGRANPAAAATGDPVRIGLFNRGGATTTTLQGNHTASVMRIVQNGSGPALQVLSPQFADQPRDGIRSHAATGIGVRGSADSGTGVYGYSEGDLTTSAGVIGESQFGSGVRGVSEEGRGVYGRSFTGPAVFGESLGSGYAGYFDGKTYVTSLDMPETTAALPPAGQARLFVRDNGSGKTQVCVQFATGSPIVLATEA